MKNYHRQAVLLLIAALGGVGFGAHADDPMTGEALYGDVVRYADFGIHRTGTPGDQATSRWVADELKNASYDVKLDPWLLRQFFIDEASLAIGGESIDCLPFWYPHDTGEEPLVARLGLLKEGGRTNALRGRIAFIEITERNWRIDLRELIAEAVRYGAVGLLVSLPSESGEVVAQNAPAPHNQEPHAIPAMIVPQKRAKFIRKAAQERSEVRMVISGRDTFDAESSNVVAKLHRGEKWIVITTPLSGWFTCAGERGPGVALFLGLARWMAEREGEHSILFLGNTGHELDQVGAHHTLDDNAPPPEDVDLWIHLGASITAREYVEVDGKVEPLEQIHIGGNLVGTEALLPTLQSAFADVEGITPRADGPVFGELAQFMDAGYNAYGFFGNFRYFHTPYDTAESTSPALLEPVGRAIQKTIDAID